MNLSANWKSLKTSCRSPDDLVFRPRVGELLEDSKRTAMAKGDLSSERS